MNISNDELSKKAYKKIKNMILSGDLEPGQKIIQDRLAEKLGISRTPLRTALQMLEAEYMVESLPKKGMAVKQFSNLEIVDIYDCRIALESLAVRLFTNIAGKAQIEKLSALFKPFVNSQKIDRKAYQKADSVFHDTIIKKCGNKYLYRLYHTGNLLYCIDMIGLVRPPEETLPEHLGIIEAIQGKDADLAGKYINVHLAKTKVFILKYIEQ